MFKVKVFDLAGPTHIQEMINNWTKRNPEARYRDSQINDVPGVAGRSERKLLLWYIPADEPAESEPSEAETEQPAG